jgi:PKD repeat protein
MKMRYPILILIAVFLAGCKKEVPVASFTFSPAAPKVGETVTFTNSSTNATGYQWSFGDGGTSQSENPTHTFAANGNFDVQLTATGEDGTDSYSATVPVEWPEPVAAFTMDKTEANVGEVVTFTNQSENAVSYAWSFGDGETSTATNPTHAYTDEGTFTVQLTATGPGGGDHSATKSITIIWPDPEAGFSTDKSVAEPGETITFTNQSLYAESYAWDFGDGATSTVTNPTHSFATEGIYTVQLTATGYNDGTDTYSTAVSIYYAPAADFTMDKTEAKTGETINFTNQSVNATSYLWKFGDGSTSTSEDAAHSWTSGGSYDVQLIATGPGGNDTISKEVTINEVNIFPGEGVRDIELVETWATIEDKMGDDVEYQGYFIDGDGYISHVWESESLGILLFLVSPTASYSPSSADILYLIALYDNYVGMTEEEIRMGSLLADVVTAYGDPDEYDTTYDSYFYDRLGIRFYYNESNIIDQMTVYPVITKKSTGIKYPTVDDLRNIRSILKK